MSRNQANQKLSGINPIQNPPPPPGVEGGKNFRGPHQHGSPVNFFKK